MSTVSLSLDQSPLANFIRFCVRFITGKVPSASSGPIRLRLGRTHVLSQINTIVRYFTRSCNRELELQGTTAEEKALVSQWMTYSLRFQQDASMKEKYLTVLDTVLLHHSYFACNRVTLADISIFWSVYPIVVKMDQKSHHKYRNLCRWFDQIQNTAGVRGYINMDLIEFQHQEHLIV